MAKSNPEQQKWFNNLNRFLKNIKFTHNADVIKNPGQKPSPLDIKVYEIERYAIIGAWDQSDLDKFSTCATTNTEESALLIVQWNPIRRSIVVDLEDNCVINDSTKIWAKPVNVKESH